MNAIGPLIFLCLWIAGVVGWFWNIVKLFQVSVPISEFGIMEVMRIIGIFVAPIGSILGFF